MMIVIALSQPVFYLILFGGAMGGMVEDVPLGENYMAYITPGIMAMTVMTSSMQVGIGIFLDRRTHMFEELLTCPVKRELFFGAKVLFGITLAILQVGAILVISIPILGREILRFNVPLVIASVLLGSVCFTSILLSLSSRITSQDIFNSVYGLMMLPLIFCSSMFYDVGAMPVWMRYIAHVNPLTYIAQTMRAGVFGIWDGGVGQDLGILAIIALCFFALAALLFRRIRV